jgi:hypothetical protein
MSNFGSTLSDITAIAATLTLGGYGILLVVNALNLL